MKTEIAKDIENAGYCIRYDAQCKKVLGHKIILAWIMRETVKEFANQTIEVIRQCIEKEPEISTVHVDPGQTNTNDKITGLATEDKVQNEGSVTFDIRFNAYVPQETQFVKLILNIEGQKDFYPGYPIITRGIYYGGRLLSSQNGIEFSNSNYGDIKKVYSIWICTEAPKYIGNAISTYDIHKTDIVGAIPDIPEHYDKLCVIIICLNENQKSENTFLNMMNTLLSPTLSIEKKKYILQSEYHIHMDNGLEEELNLMCNISEHVWEMASREGRKAGFKDGLETGTKTVISNLLKSGLLSEEQIISVSGISKDELKEIRLNMQN